MQLTKIKVNNNMTILQLFQETFSDPSMYGYMGVGSGIGASAGTIITMLVNKVSQ